MLRGAIVALALSVASYAADTYCFGFLNTHPERAAIANEQAQEIQKQHMAYLGQMAAEGRLVTAGPLATPGGARGLLVYRCASVEEAAGFAGADPAVRQKRLAVEMYGFRTGGEWGQPLGSRLKADANYKYEMVQLPFAIFVPTERSPDDGALATHSAYLEHLRRHAKARAHGMFDGDGQKIGIVVFSAVPMDEARALAEQSPLLRDGVAKAEMHIWYVADEAVPR